MLSAGYLNVRRCQLGVPVWRALGKVMVIVVFGRDQEQARYVAEAVAREAFHNVALFAGSYEEVVQAFRE